MTIFPDFILVFVLLSSWLFAQDFNISKSDIRILAIGENLSPTSKFRDIFNCYTALNCDSQKNQQIKQQLQSTDSSDKKVKFPSAGYIGSVSFGLLGAMIGNNVKTHSSGSSDVLQYRTGDGHSAKIGASIGGSAGTILGCLAKRKEIKSKYKFIKIITGSVLGGIAGYHLADNTFGLSTILFPPLAANIILSF